VPCRRATTFPRDSNRLENHDPCLAKIRQGIDATAEAGFPNVITFSRQSEGDGRAGKGLKNCAIGLKKIAGYAEQKKVTVCLELLTHRSITRTTWPIPPSGASSWSTGSVRRESRSFTTSIMPP